MIPPGTLLHSQTSALFAASAIVHASSSFVWKFSRNGLRLARNKNFKNRVLVLLNAWKMKNSLQQAVAEAVLVAEILKNLPQNLPTVPVRAAGVTIAEIVSELAPGIWKHSEQWKILVMFEVRCSIVQSQK